jgi:hypothetical protein
LAIISATYLSVFLSSSALAFASFFSSSNAYFIFSALPLLIAPASIFAVSLSFASLALFS